MSANDTDVNTAFLYSAGVLNAIEVSLSPERMARYVAKTNGDREKAIKLYTWNSAVSAAFYGPLQGLEIALRNSVHVQLSKIYGQDWYDNPACGLDNGTLKRVDAAKFDLKREGYPADPPHMVAALSFGFWVSLLGSGGRLGSGVKANYEMTLWRKALFKSFPNIRTNRKAVHLPLDYLRTFRNRIAHHEPIFKRHLSADYASLLDVTHWISRDTHDWIVYHSRVPSLLSEPYDDILKF